VGRMRVENLWPVRTVDDISVLTISIDQSDGTMVVLKCVGPSNLFSFGDSFIIWCTFIPQMV
jgi:hypothetical protein